MNKKASIIETLLVKCLKMTFERRVAKNSVVPRIITSINMFS